MTIDKIQMAQSFDLKASQKSQFAVVVVVFFVFRFFFSAILCWALPVCFPPTPVAQCSAGVMEADPPYFHGYGRCVMCGAELSEE